VAGAPRSSATPVVHGFAIDQDFPDPDVLRVGDTYYAYATNSSSENVQVATSKDLATWTVLDTDALPDLPDWAIRGKTWAPDVSEPSPGHYVMYFAASDVDPMTQCIGVATATAPTGPFTSSATSPLVCPAGEGGAIDPASFTDSNGTPYLLWKNDGNSRGLDTWLQISQVSADRTKLVGRTTRLIRQTLPWEGNLIEAPMLTEHDGTYYLFYSANNYADASYAVGYATASHLLGPYVKHPSPFLSTTSSAGRYFGPGGEDIVTAADGTGRIVFHSWDKTMAYRGMNVLPFAWVGAKPVVTLPPK